ncbi:MerR family transcriptional regulator [Streptomyces cylindrosporus]|uniref:MerR family transcriptional regulator n=1 Tax=Streptomyces cylindrosporus TaxID=2927583 RepID=A0ABS9YK45_9ACTN|nr:MerR family transcriptional regulator [Streptomyces cylindrosporus]MCI3277633.1 MerR family transcriptional regulator [Streptomyces cylindrosporus]
MIDLAVDLQTARWTVAEAAEAAGVRPGVIRAWKHRGHLPAAAHDDHGRPLFKPIDVIKAEKATRERARRTH